MNRHHNHHQNRQQQKQQRQQQHQNSMCPVYRHSRSHRYHRRDLGITRRKLPIRDLLSFISRAGTTSERLLGNTLLYVKLNNGRGWLRLLFDDGKEEKGRRILCVRFRFCNSPHVVTFGARPVASIASTCLSLHSHELITPRSYPV